MRPAARFGFLLLTLAVSGCMSPAGGRQSVDSQTEAIRNEVDWMKSEGMNYGSEGIPQIQSRSRGGPVFPSAFN
jgi:hypothetical protein